MKGWLSVIGSGVGSAIAACGIWWIVNQVHTVNGAGWLQRQFWPLNNVYLVALGAGIWGLLGALHARRGRRHAQEIADLCREWGFTYSAQVARDTFRPMPLFQSWSEACNGMSGQKEGVPVAIFDLATVSRGDESASTRCQTVFLLPAEGLPDFDLRPRGVAAHVVGMLGMHGMTFDPQSVGDPVAAAQVRWFQKHFYLVHLVEGEERAVRKLFTSTLMKRLNRYTGWSVQAQGGQLALWRENKVQPAAARRRLLEQALEVRATLVEAQAGATEEEILPSPQGQELERQVAGVRAGCLGGCAGVGLGFVAAFLVLALVLPALDLKAGQFWITAIVFFGTLGLAVALGAAFGAFVARSIVSRRPGGRLTAALAGRRAIHPGAWLFGLGFAALGTILLVVGLGMGVQSARFAAGAHRAEGTVIKLVSGDDNTTAPLVRYQVGTKSYESQGSLFTSPPAYSVGQEVTVLYRPDQPDAGRIDTFVDRWLLPLALGGVGSIFAVIGCAVLVSWSRKGKARTGESAEE